MGEGVFQNDEDFLTSDGLNPVSRVLIVMVTKASIGFMAPGFVPRTQRKKNSWRVYKGAFIRKRGEIYYIKKTSQAPTG